MSEERNTESSTGNGLAAHTRTRKAPLAESEIDGNLVRFKVVATGEAVECDVSKLPAPVQFRNAQQNVITIGRLAFQKLDDPTKVTEALRAKFSKLAAGEMTSPRRTVTVVDDLTQAVANHLKKDASYVRDVWFPKIYYANEKQSGCTTQITSDGKTRIYNKAAANLKLRNTPAIAAELRKIAEARTGKGKDAGVDLASLTD